MNLTHYERYKLDLAALLRSRSLAAPAYDAKREALAAALARDQFKLVTVGRFSRGKSTLMNALLRTTHLPMGIIPLTSVITMVIYGSAPRATLYYRDRNLFLNIAIDEIASYITEQGNPGNRARLSRAEIELPSSLLRYGVCFVDTPGLGSAISENNKTTLDFLAEASALLVVTSFESALSVEEISLLHFAKNQQLQVFLVVNKADLVSQAEQDEVLAHIQQILAQEQLESVKIFPVSALAALNHQHHGVENLRRAIIQFCVVVGQQRLLTELATQIHSLLVAAGDETGVQLLAALMAKLTDTTDEADADDLAESSARRPCPVCTVVGQSAFQAFSILQADLARNNEQREAFAQGPGLCRLHAHRFGKIADPLATAQGLADIIEAIATRLDDSGQDPVSGNCPLCQRLQCMEAEAVQQIAARMPDDSALICLPHLPKLLAALPASERPAILQRLTKQYERLAEDLRRFALHREGAQRSLITAEEARAAVDAIHMLAGDEASWWQS